MRGVNKVILVGRVGQDPEFKTMTSGDGLATFSMATGERWRDKNTNETKERTEWHNIKCWRRLAEIVRDYVKKGQPLYIEGKMRTEKWQDKEGVDKQRTVIEVTELQMLGSKNENNQSSSGKIDPSDDNQQPNDGPIDMDDDLPF